MRVVKRNLFVTLRMLRTAGIEAGARVVGERIHVFLKIPERGEPPLAASFGGLRWFSLSEDTEYYKHVEEVMVSPQQWEGKALQLHGYVVPGSAKGWSSVK